MNKIGVVYWSGTGNTEAMAFAVADGARGAGSEVSVLTASEFAPEMVDSFDTLAFGCPSMGVEELEESEFAPMFESCRDKLNGKSIALFGSYGWGDGEWMRNWEESCRGCGAALVCVPVICCEAPDEAALTACRKLGETLV